MKANPREQPVAGFKTTWTCLRVTPMSANAASDLTLRDAFDPTPPTKRPNSFASRD